MLVACLCVFGLLGAPRAAYIAPRHRADVVCSDTKPRPLLIVGAGVLGRLAAAEWQRHGKSGEIVGVTRTEDAVRDAALRAEGIVPRLRAEVDAESASQGTRWPYVLFCASPGGNDDYAEAVADALRLWDPKAGGRFVFTSSAGVYAEEDGGAVTERSPVTSTPRAARLLAAEEAVLSYGGTVLRLAGLYLEDRGAHNAWLSMTEVKRRPDGLINQVMPLLCSCLRAAHAASATSEYVLALAVRVPINICEGCSWQNAAGPTSLLHRCTTEMQRRLPLLRSSEALPDRSCWLPTMLL